MEEALISSWELCSEGQHAGNWNIKIDWFINSLTPDICKNIHRYLLLKVKQEPQILYVYLRRLFRESREYRLWTMNMYHDIDHISCNL